MTEQRKFGEQYDPAGVCSGSALIRPRERKGEREGERESEIKSERNADAGP